MPAIHYTSVLASDSQMPILFDLSDENQSENFYTDMDGKWYFFENKLLDPQEVKDKIIDGSGEIVSLPDSFESQTGNLNTYGTYSTIIKLPKSNMGETLAIHVPYQYSAYKLFVEHNVVAENGNVGYDATIHNSEMAPKIGYFFVQTDEILVTMQISSFEHIRGGFENSIFLGEASHISRKFNTDLIGNLFINGCVFIIGLFMTLFGLYRRQERVFLIFGMFAMFISARSLFTDPFYYKLLFLDMTWTWGTRIEYILTEASSLFYVILLWKWHEKEFSKKIMYGLVAVHGVLIITTFFTKPVFFQTLFFNVFYLAIPTFIYLIYVVAKSIRNKNQTAKVNLIGMGLIFLAFFNDFAIGQNWYQSWNLMLPAVAIYVFIHVILMSKDFADRTRKTEQQNKELLQLNDSNKKLTDKLQKEIKQKDDFLASTSHELRNPLHGIINIAQTLLNNNASKLNKDMKEDLSLQLTIGYHMSQTLNDLLDITRLRDDQIQLELQRLDIHAVSSGVSDMFKAMIGNKDVQIKVDVSRDFPHVIADENRMIQILFNLLHNAVKFTEQGTITVSATQVNNMAHIKVKDTGIGMDKKLLKTIFQPYEQGDMIVEGGIGLGLNICQQLVDRHGGTLRAESVLGEGSEFIFTLPIADDSFEEQPKRTAPKIKKQKISLNHVPTNMTYELTKVLHEKTAYLERPKILVIDDDPVNLKLVSDILSAEHYDVKTVLSGAEALKQIDIQKWNLVITDIMMPSMSGYELTRLIREKYSISELPILMLTARGNIEDIYTGFSAGVNDYVIKPVDSVELNVRVQALTAIQISVHERLRLEAAWLQAQMRPHFLLNTLNSIVSLSEIDKKRMVKLIEVFAQYLQSSFYLKNIDTQIPLQEELDLVKAYLYIEKERFGDRLKVRLDIDDIHSVKVPPLSIQTLVENAVNHGVLKRAEGGQVMISVKNEAGQTRITISDDGVGMDEEKLSEIFNATSDQDKGIGIINTDKRLKQLYGKGLKVQSKPGVGSTITFMIPDTTGNLALVTKIN